MKVAVDADKCCGAGSCVMTAPEVFDQRDEDGTVVLLEAELDESHHDAVLEAADLCPALAIQVRRDA